MLLVRLWLEVLQRKGRLASGWLSDGRLLSACNGGGRQALAIAAGDERRRLATHSGRPGRMDLTLPPRSHHNRCRAAPVPPQDELMPRYAELVYNGFWFSPERLALQVSHRTTDPAPACCCVQLPAHLPRLQGLAQRLPLVMPPPLSRSRLPASRCTL
jgi:hypothetical protein